MLNSFTRESLRVKVYPDRDPLGRAAARDAAAKINELLLRQQTVTVIFAAAPSQEEFLRHLRGQPLPWHRVVALHMDEYMHFNPRAPQSFGRFLQERLFSHVPLGECHLFRADAADIEAERLRYAAILAQHPVDVACIGIGENCHIAFNDPENCDFNEPQAVKQVALSPASRRQQVHDGCFASLAEVPETALTVTLPPLLAAKAVFCMVPGPTKAAAVAKTLLAPLGPETPSTILRGHGCATLYVDKAAYSAVQEP